MNRSDRIKRRIYYLKSSSKKLKAIEYQKEVHIGSIVKQNLEERFRYSLDNIRYKKVLVVGAGTLGNELVKNLILSGVTDLTIVDNDIYVIENLPRSTLIKKTDIGLSKANILALRAIQKSPFTARVVSINGDILDLGWGFLENFDLVYSPVDNIGTRYYLNKGCLFMGKPHITLGTNFMGVQTFMGEVVFTPSFANTCLECVWAIQESEELIKRLQCKNLDEKKEIQPQVMCFSSIVSGVASYVGLKFLLGKFDISTNSNRYFISNNATIKSYSQTELHPRCSIHGKGLHKKCVHEVTLVHRPHMSDLYKAINGIFGNSDEDYYKVDLEWAELHNTVYNPDDPIKMLYVEKADDNFIPSFLPNDHIYLVYSGSKEELIRINN